MRYTLALVVLAIMIASCGGDSGLAVDDFIELNNLDTRQLDDGVHIITRTPGNGDRPPNLDTRVFVNYTGMLTDSVVFDSRENSFFLLRNVIRGWQVGIREMSVGEKATLIIPASAAYGSSGSGIIPGDATLLFEVELLKYDDGTDLTPTEYAEQNNLETRELDQGVLISTSVEGTGESPADIDTRVYVNYEGRLTDGTVFDQNDSTNFILRNVIEGWQIGLQAMSVGESATLIIPSTVGYGAIGNGPIPPGATLIFDVDLLDIE